MKKAVTTVVYFCIVLGLIMMSWWLGRLTAPAEFTYTTDTVTDTITDWQYDTVFRVDTRVVKLPIHDTTTVTDSLWLTDSVLVEPKCFRSSFILYPIALKIPLFLL